MFDSKKIFARHGNRTRKALARVDVCLGAMADVHAGTTAPTLVATGRVDLIAAGMRATLALCAGGMTILPPTERGKNRTRWWYEFKERPHSFSLTQSLRPKGVQIFCPFQINFHYLFPTGFLYPELITSVDF